MSSIPPIIGSICSPEPVGLAPLDHLQEEGEVGDGAEEREADDQPDRRGEGEGPVGEEAQRQHRLARAALDEEEAEERRARAAPPSARIGAELHG